MAHSDKTEAPTPKKKKEARKEGNIPRSPELVSWGGLLVATFLVPKVFSATAGSVTDLLHSATDAMRQPEPGVATKLLGTGARTVLTSVAPIMAGMVVWGLIANLAQTRGSTHLSRLKPKPDRLNPLKGIKKLLSPQGLWQGAKTLLKAFILVTVAFGPLRDMVEQLAAARRPPLPILAGVVGDTALRVARTVAFAGLGLGVLDYVLARRRIGKGLKMTKQEVKDESRMSEGDPQVKAQIRARQREASRNRMLAAVADASVVIVNPVHLAVALRYEPTKGAPVLVAKGRGELAERIREQARANLVPLVRDVPLAWALHDTCKLDRPVPPELFEAVARVLAFVMTVARRSAMGGVVNLPGLAPKMPEKVGRRALRAPRALPAGAP